MKEIFTAASVEEARAKAAESFGVEEEKIAFTVIEEPKKGLFGKIKGEAKVEASYEPPTKTQAAQAYITEPADQNGHREHKRSAYRDRERSKFRDRRRRI